MTPATASPHDGDGRAEPRHAHDPHARDREWGTLRVDVEQTLPLDAAATGLDTLGNGGAHGKLVVTVAASERRRGCGRTLMQADTAITRYLRTRGVLVCRNGAS